MKIEVNEEDGNNNVQLEEKPTLIDSFGRIARKLRISVTDRCNMKCMYCMPPGNVQWFKQNYSG